MVDRGDRHFWLKVIIGVVFAILVVAVLALAYAVIPLAASQQKRAEPPTLFSRLTYSPVEQALILPTHDPRKPWVTRTPRPTATPWLFLATTIAAERLATPRPRGNAAQGALDAVRIDTVPKLSGVIAPVALSSKVTGTEPVESSGPTLLSAQGGEPTGSISQTPSPSVDDGAAMLPIETLEAPTSTLDPTQLQVTDQPPPPIMPGDPAQFTAYVMDQYGAIAGQVLTIAATTLDTTENGAARLVVEVAGDGASDVFADQTAAAALDYGHRLLNDLKYYFNGQNCAIEVINTYETSNGGACTNNPPWCILDTFDASANTWMVTRTYVRGTSVIGLDNVETGNTGH